MDDDTQEPVESDGEDSLWDFDFRPYDPSPISLRVTALNHAVSLAKEQPDRVARVVVEDAKKFYDFLLKGE